MDAKGVLLKEGLPCGSTVDGQYFADLTRLRKTNKKTRNGTLQNLHSLHVVTSLHLLHDVTSHKAQFVQLSAKDLAFKIS